jgi:hypothetical protein
MTVLARAPRFVDALVKGADFAKGSRFLPGGGSADITPTRRLGNTALNRNANALFQVQDAIGPLRRGIIINSCQTARLAEATVATRPFLKTLYELSNPPMIEDIC